MPQWNRRDFLAAVSVLSSSALLPHTAWSGEAGSWSAGELNHLIPTANHQRFAIKCSFKQAQQSDPALRVGEHSVTGKAADAERRFFSFDIDNLKPDTEYTLQLVGASNKPLCDAWPLRTFPAPDQNPEQVRVLIYTCAGGHPIMQSRNGGSVFLPIATRQRLLNRALSFQPQALIANGDHIYWDQRSWMESKNEALRKLSTAMYQRIGMLDRNLPAYGTSNEISLKAAANPQISDLYGVSLRSTPSYFINDDHDYFENDEAEDNFVTLPPYQYQLEFSRFVRNMYFPEFLPDANRPVAMSGSSAGDREPGISESFGTFRYGKLAEALLYDCGRYLSLKGESAGLIAPEAEKWLLDRTRDETVQQLFHVPSHPFGWSAGKWREWYPDVADSGSENRKVVAKMHTGELFKLTKEQRKFMWQDGWWSQHQRLLEALNAQKKRAGIILSGDLHAIGHGKLEQSGNLDLRNNPVHTVLTGPLGTGTAWPSASRGTPPMTAIDIGMDPLTPAQEKNGFTILDIMPQGVRMRLFAWRNNEPEDVIDTLEPYHEVTIGRS
ncbi:MAG: hypothetical protein AAF512_12905 [Pseudomonadota bacterium]